ncbi:hypothetical protein N4S61_31710, partial [Burkholderia pseudomallei]|nr:hypothetical protein [Burkholderia pseudomallei]
MDAVIVRAASAWLTLAVDAPRFVKTRSDAPRCTQMHPNVSGEFVAAAAFTMATAAPRRAMPSQA